MYLPNHTFYSRNRPVVPLPNPGEGGPVYPGPDASTPVIPLPNPGEGGPVYPGPPSVSWPNLCYYCTAGRNAAVRFLNAAEGYNPFRVFLNNNLIVNSLSFGALTPYGRVTNGYQTVTVTGPDGYIYLQKSLPFRADSQYTVAVTKTASGLDLTQITDDSCPHPGNLSCLRLCNLAYNSNPLDLLLANGRMIYTDVRFRESTPFKRIRPGDYQFYLAETGQYAAPYLGVIDLRRGLPALRAAGFLLSDGPIQYLLYHLCPEPGKHTGCNRTFGGRGFLNGCLLRQVIAAGETGRLCRTRQRRLPAGVSERTLFRPHHLLRRP